MTALLKYRTEELMQTSISYRCQFLFKLFCLLFIALSRRKRCALKRCVSSFQLHQKYILALQRHAGQPAVLQALTLGHMGSNDYSTTEIFVDNNFSPIQYCTEFRT